MTTLLSDEHAKAAAARLSPQAATHLTQSYRDGDDGALTELVAGLRWLAYAAWLPDSCDQLLAERPELANSLNIIKIDDLEWCGSALLAVHETFTGRGRGKGARNPKSKVPGDPYHYVIAELYRAYRTYHLDCGDKIDPHIRAPHSTNSKRKKRGLDPHPTVRRNRSHETDRWINREPSKLSRKAKDKPPRSRTGYKYGEECDQNQFAVNDPEWLDLADETDREICDLLSAGCTLREIAEQLGLTLHEVRKAIAAIRERNS